jgi:hypothetical protein
VTSLGLPLENDDGGHREVNNISHLDHISFDLNKSDNIKLWPDEYANKFDLIIFSETIEHLHIAPEYCLNFLHYLLNNDSGKIILTTPNAVLAQLKRDLNSSYPNSVIRQDKPCVTLDFAHCKIELTPAIPAGYYPEQGYYIPKQGTNEWMLTDDPKRAESRLSQANTRLNGKLTPLIKMIKHAKNNNNIRDIKSYEIEDIAIRNVSYMSNYRDGVQQMFRCLGWTVNNMNQFQLEQLSEQEFAKLCRTSIFGCDFPE